MFDAYVYKIEFPDGYFYIGSSIHPKNRFATHRRDMLSAAEYNRKNNYACYPTSYNRFERYISKNGWNNPHLHIVETVIVDSIHELQVVESAHIRSVINSDPKNLNTRIPVRTEEERKNKNLYYGRIMTDDDHERREEVIRRSKRNSNYFKNSLPCTEQEESTPSL
jgi:hypothetical protein